jgi:hypothetical protein
METGRGGPVAEPRARALPFASEMPYGVADALHGQHYPFVNCWLKTEGGFDHAQGYRKTAQG